MNNHERSAYLNQLLEPLADFKRLKHRRQQGTIGAFDIDVPDASQFARRYHEQALQRGLLLRPIGNTVYWMPPYVLDEPDMQTLASGIIETLHATLKAA